MSKKKTPGSRYWDLPIPLSTPPTPEDIAALYAKIERDHQIKVLPYDLDEALPGFRLGQAMVKMTQILKEANLRIENGPPIEREGKLIRTVEGLGYRPYIDKEWYAAKILHQISLVLPGTGNAETAILLGMLMREADIRFGLISENARNAGQQPKSIRVVDSFVRAAIRKHPTFKCRELWESIP